MDINFLLGEGGPLKSPHRGFTLGEGSPLQYANRGFILGEDMPLQYNGPTADSRMYRPSIYKGSSLVPYKGSPNFVMTENGEIINIGPTLQSAPKSQLTKYQGSPNYIITESGEIISKGPTSDSRIPRATNKVVNYKGNPNYTLGKGSNLYGQPSRPIQEQLLLEDKKGKLFDGGDYSTVSHKSRLKANLKNPYKKLGTTGKILGTVGEALNPVNDAALILTGIGSLANRNIGTGLGQIALGAAGFTPWGKIGKMGKVGLALAKAGKVAKAHPIVRQGVGQAMGLGPLLAKDLKDGSLDGLLNASKLGSLPSTSKSTGSNVSKTKDGIGLEYLPDLDKKGESNLQQIASGSQPSSNVQQTQASSQEPQDYSWIDRYMDRLEEVNAPYVEAMGRYLNEYPQLSDDAFQQQRFMTGLAGASGNQGYNQLGTNYNPLTDRAAQMGIAGDMRNTQLGNLSEYAKVLGNSAMAQQLGLPAMAGLGGDGSIKAYSDLQKALYDLQGRMYNADQRFAGTKYNADSRLAGSKYAADMGMKGRLGQAMLFNGTTLSPAYAKYLGLPSAYSAEGLGKGGTIPGWTAEDEEMFGG